MLADRGSISGFSFDLMVARGRNRTTQQLTVVNTGQTSPSRTVPDYPLVGRCRSV